MVALLDVWPEIKQDVTKVTWAHAVNSLCSLQEALQSDSIMMLEADVNLGSVDGSETALSGSKVPIMAHPPDITSDLSLEDFINTIVKHVTLGGKSKKGFKLDFKELSIVEPSLKILKKVESQLCSIPFWLNADILRGPSLDSTAAKSTTALPLDAGKFVQVCRKYFEGATLSLGWTTGPCPNDASFYRDSHIEQMIDVIRENSLETFAVRACLLQNTKFELLDKLLSSAGSKSTITVWTAAGDEVNADALALIISRIGKRRVFLDLPFDLKEKLDKNTEEKRCFCT